MYDQKIINKFIELSEGKLSPEEWKSWFSENIEHVEKNCGRTNFLKIKPSNNCSEIQNIYYGQTAAFNWLKSKNIQCGFSELYKINYEKEFENFCKIENEKRNQLKKSVDLKFGHLREIYPKLIRQLKKSFDECTRIKPGKSTDEIEAKENEFSSPFSDDLKTFFNHISLFEFEGVEINFNALDKLQFNKKDYLLLGEFWRHADGDQLLYDIESQNIVVFAHEYDPPKILKEAGTMTEFIEKVLVQHLKEYEE